MKKILFISLSVCVLLWVICDVYLIYSNKTFTKDQIDKMFEPIAGEIDQHGFKCSGSYDPFRRIVFLVNSGNQTKEDAVSTFHHEFSSLLLTSHSFFINPWED